MSGASRQYDDHLDMLIALITYLGLTRWRSRSPNGLARDLSLDETAVTRTLTAFPGLFRRSPDTRPTDAGPQHSYTLHARYALRRQQIELASTGPDTPPTSLSDPTDAQEGTGEELNAETLSALLDYVANQARAEREHSRHALGQWIAVLSAFVAAMAAVVAALIA